MSENKKSISDEQIRKNINADIACAVSALNMLRNDPEMMRAIEDIVISRIRIAEENAANEKLEFAK